LVTTTFSRAGCPRTSLAFPTKAPCEATA
jgi:hypothetical protein